VDGYYWIHVQIEQIKSINILVQLITALVQENIIRLATASLTGFEPRNKEIKVVAGPPSINVNSPACPLIADVMLVRKVRRDPFH
jgi:hypothetical protein